MRALVAVLGGMLIGSAACRDVGRAALPPAALRSGVGLERERTGAARASRGGSDRVEPLVDAEPALGGRHATFVRLGEPGSRYARAAVNVPLHWQLATGPVIGFVRQGAVVLGAPSDLASFVVAEFPAAPLDGVLMQAPSAELGAWAPPSIAASDVPRELVAQHGAEIRYGLYRELSVEPGETPFAFVRCGRLAVLERRGKSMRVAADYPSGELHGWIEAAAPGERDAGCDHPRGLPRGYAEFSGASTAFQALDARQAEVHWRTGHTCESWKFTATERGKKLVRVVTPLSPRAEWSYELRDGLLWLFSLSTELSGGMTTSSAVEAYRIADTNNEVLWALPVLSPTEPVEAYRIASLKPWFRTLNGCLAAARGRVAAP